MDLHNKEKEIACAIGIVDGASKQWLHDVWSYK